MAWVKIPPEHHPLFLAALPKDPRVETVAMFGGIAAKANGHMFAGLFGRSAMVMLPDDARGEALALDGAEVFDPMGDGRWRSDKVLLPEAVMDDAEELRGWLARALQAALAAAPKAAKKKAAGSPKVAAKKTAKAAPAKSAAKKRPATKR